MEFGCGLMMKKDKIQLRAALTRHRPSCGLMMKKDKIQPALYVVFDNVSCGLMMKKDKIQQLQRELTYAQVVV